MVFVLGDDESPRAIRPYVTIAIIAMCILAQSWQIFVPQAAEAAFLSNWGLTPASFASVRPDGGDVLAPSVWLTPLTALFLHADLIHLAGNMYALWVFGDNVEDALGHVRFAGLYLAAGIFGMAAEAFTHQNSVLPIIGASGAVSGVMGAYLFLRPEAMLKVGWGQRWPTWVVLPLWLMFNMFGLANDDGGIAWVAHILGFCAGALLGLAMRRLEWQGG